MISNMTQEDYDKVEQHWKEIGLLSITSGAHSAEDESIPFSRWDKCYTTTYKYKERPDEVHERLERVSKYFQWANDILTDFGYKLERENTPYTFSFRHPNYEIGCIGIHANNYHKGLFQITSVFAYSSDFVKIETYKDMQDFIEKCITFVVKRTGDVQLNRELKIKQLLNESLVPDLKEALTIE